MINARLTDVLNAIMPVRNFLNEALEKIKEEEKEQAEKEETKKKALEQNGTPVYVIAGRDPDPTSKNVMDTPEASDDDKTPKVDATGSLVFKFWTCFCKSWLKPFLLETFVFNRLGQCFFFHSINTQK